MDIQKIIEEIKGATVLEINELVKACEEEFGVSAAAPVMVAGAADAAAGGAAEADEKSEFAVELTEFGQEKVKVIKVIKEITGLGLKDAKDLVDGAPTIIKEGLEKPEAEAIAKQIEEAGGKATLK